ncbi:hypothetical protein ABUL04_30640 [Micromonospora harpali]|uniref:Uncharacterized protein n=1 Tax=Micromonospora harpali TaxID=1490225 RepID=A0ABW1HNT0_9ACTN
MTAVRFTNSQRGYLIVCAPLAVTTGALAHRIDRYTIGIDADGTTVVEPLHTFHGQRRHIVWPACQPAPTDDDPHSGRGWAELSAGWADHRGALACPQCFPPEVTG